MPTFCFWSCEETALFSHIRFLHSSNPNFVDFPCAKPIPRRCFFCQWQFSFKTGIYVNALLCDPLYGKIISRWLILRFMQINPTEILIYPCGLNAGNTFLITADHRFFSSDISVVYSWQSWGRSWYWNRISHIQILFPAFFPLRRSQSTSALYAWNWSPPALPSGLCICRQVAPWYIH